MSAKCIFGNPSQKHDRCNGVTGQSLIRDEGRIPLNIHFKELAAQEAIIEAYVLSKAEKISIGGSDVISVPYELNDIQTSRLDFGGIPAPEGWRPRTDLPLDQAIPVPWPQSVIDRWGQYFHPNAFFHNSRQICGYYEETEDADAVELAQRLFERFHEFTIDVDGALYVLYRYDREYRGIPVEGPWTSGYASGAALIALTALDTCLGVDGAKQSADAILEGMARPIDPRQERPVHWVSFVDDDGFLWFEEMPLDQEEQPRILNGHIRALTGLYAYWSYYETDASARLLQAGATTVAHYAPDYRIPGGINRYDLMAEAVDDYGPERTISQQNQLFRFTGDPIFAIYRDVFEADMRDEIKAAKTED